MRYFVVSGTDPATVHVIAEIVRDFEGADRGDSLAGQIAGPRVRVLTEVEVLAIPGGAKILERWRNGDDGRFHLESLRLAREAERKEHIPTLRLVSDAGSVEEAKVQENRVNSLLERAVDLQAQTMDILERMKARENPTAKQAPRGRDEDFDGMDRSTGDGR
jgi:hypothetical protein